MTATAEYEDLTIDEMENYIAEHDTVAVQVGRGELMVAPMTGLLAGDMSQIGFGALVERVGGRMSATGLELPNALDISDYAIILKRAGSEFDSAQAKVNHFQFVIGDAIRFGEARYGEKYSQFTGITNTAQGTLRNWAVVANAIPIQERRAGLTFDQHKKLAVKSLPEAARRTIMDMAEAEAMTSAEVGRLVDTFTRTVDRLTDDTDGIPLPYYTIQPTVKSVMGVIKEMMPSDQHEISVLAENLYRTYGVGTLTENIE